MATSLKGHTGKVLRVDLSREQTSVEPLNEDTLRKFVGGTGVGGWLLYRETPAGATWDSPENRLILTSGPLNGLRVAGCGSYSVITKGPLTNGGTSAQANGYFGAYLKFAGYDAIVFQGCSPRWKYLYVHGGKAELRDASHLVGLDTWQTGEAIQKELGKSERELRVVGIGPAGENLVRFAAIVGDRGHVAAHNGVGAVMGSKKLKAVAAARGAAKITAYDPGRVTALGKKMVEATKADPLLSLIYNWGTGSLLPTYAKSGVLPVKNLTTNLFPEADRFSPQYYRSRFETKLSPCWACPSHHLHMLKVTEGPYAGYVGEEPEYEVLAGFGSLIGSTDPGAAVMLGDVTDRMGLDANETGWLLAFIMECYERGIITKSDTDGLEIGWGNVEAARELIGRLARRQGFGNLLAEGVMRAAQAIGGEALNCAVYSKKGHAPRGHDHRARWLEILDYATSGCGTIESGLQRLSDPFSPEEVPAVLAREKGRFFSDSMVICQFPSLSVMGGNLGYLVDLLNATTGWDYSLDEVAVFGQRMANLFRAFNIRQGIGTDVEQPSPRYGSAPVDGPVQGKSIMPYWEQMLDTYYRHMGWDRSSGRPLPETLMRVGLEEVVDDIW